MAAIITLHNKWKRLEINSVRDPDLVFLPFRNWVGEIGRAALIPLFKQQLQRVLESFDVQFAGSRNGDVSHSADTKSVVLKYSTGNIAVKDLSAATAKAHNFSLYCRNATITDDQSIAT
ncbi:MAG: hypothetical protein LC803_08870 [Acidobacteria bacterium]|nr:hypothetical protein [Acidobacteriota bacterium]